MSDQSFQPALLDAEPVSVLSRFAGPEGRHRAVTALCEQRPVLGNVALAEELLDRGELQLYEPGEHLMVEGDWTNSIHFLLAGSVTVKVAGFRLVERAAGIHLGEIETINPARPRSATITALEPTVALCVSEAAFAAIAGKAPEMWRQIARELAERISDRNRFVRPSNPVPRIFVACSTEALPVARAFCRRLQKETLIPDIWNGGVFKPSQHLLESLGQELNKADFALAIFSPDDKVESRGQIMAAPRDNTVYELGLFAGAIGRARSFCALPRRVPVKVPSDLTGITMLRYQVSDTGRTRIDCSDACAHIMERVAALGAR